MPYQYNSQMEECIARCREAHAVCQEVLFSHCFEKGSWQVEKEHVKMLADCVEACRTAIDSMERGSVMHVYECSACAEICEACTKSCERIGGKEMAHCADACRRCAMMCREMGNLRHAA